MKTFHAITAALAIGWALAAAPLHAQVLSGSLVVDVRDQSGAAVPGADVTITQTETNWTPERHHERDRHGELLDRSPRHLHGARRACRASANR